MAKFIVEVSDGYIRERADIDNIIETYKDNKDAIIEGMANIVIFNLLCAEIEKGNNEFTITSKDLEGMTLRLFNQAVIRLGAIYSESLVAKMKEKEEQQQ